MKFLVCTLLSVLSIFASFANGQSTQEFSPRTIQPDLTCSPAPCRLPNVRVTSGKKVSDTAPNLAINPQNPSQMILGVVDTSCASWVAAYRTNDGGMSWTKVCLPVAGSIDVIGRAWMAYDDSGAVHALLGTSNLDCGENLILETHSSDNGATWSPLNQVRSVQFAVLDSQARDSNPGSPFARNLYGSSTEMVSFTHPQVKVWRSADGGTTWASAVAATLPDTFGFERECLSHIELGKDGTIS